MRYLLVRVKDWMTRIANILLDEEFVINLEFSTNSDWDYRVKVQADKLKNQAEYPDYIKDKIEGVEAAKWEDS